MSNIKKHCTKQEREKRIFMVQGWIIEGLQDRLIIKNIMQLWDIEIRQAQRYVKEAYENWKKVEGVNLDMKREMKIARLQQLVKSLKDQYKGTPAGISAIMAVEKEIIKLEGLELPKKIQLQSSVPPLELRIINGNDNN
jgi:hypothetical protein